LGGVAGFSGRFTGNHFWAHLNGALRGASFLLGCRGELLGPLGIRGRGGIAGFFSPGAFLRPQPNPGPFLGGGAGSDFVSFFILPVLFIAHNDSWDGAPGGGGGGGFFALGGPKRELFQAQLFLWATGGRVARGGSSYLGPFCWGGRGKTGRGRGGPVGKGGLAISFFLRRGGKRQGSIFVGFRGHRFRKTGPGQCSAGGGDFFSSSKMGRLF